MKSKRIHSHFPQDREEPRKGGAPQDFHRETQFSNATPKNEKSPCTDSKGIHYRQTCHDCDVNHLRKGYPYSQIPKPQTMMLPSMQIVEKRVNHSLKSFHIMIALVSKKKNVSISAHVDPKTNHSVLSYQVWEALGRPILKPITYGFTKPITMTQQCLGFIILTFTIQNQPMSCTFYVANMGETVEDVTLGQFWMCQTDYHLDDKVNTYSLKVNSLILTREECTKEPIKVLEVLPSQEASSKILVNPIMEIGPPKKRITFRQSTKPLVTPTTKDHPKKSKVDTQEPFQQQQQGYKRWESHYSTWRKKIFQPLLQRSTTTKMLTRESSTTNTYKDKGKGKAIEESNIVLEYPQVIVAQEIHQLIKESMASSSTTPTTKNLQEARLKNARRGKSYQPKYPSQRSQQRKPQQVLVPKHMLQEQRLCIGDEHKWVERQATRSKNSSGWISTQLSLEAQGYNQGNRELWLQKPEFTAYKVHPMIDLPTGGVPKQHQRTQQQRRAKRKSNPRRGQTTSGHQTTKDRYVWTWIPKEITSQISAKEKSNLTWIKAKRTKFEAYEQYIVSQDLLKAQGYYYGQPNLWLPRALLQSQAGQSKPLQEDLHQ